ncbi:hypothetical protein DFH08DRAFT_1086416 [Mycena albidolilacea]|uniref:F-box domain-containing protein n=1 Tax=Mycena albidolilacea TaxID=1033008 RepID=A0AAD6ZF80_9AGAR|nr:hypothetical protein DFH08DRAFT_1086416 [Mycena albidolilacea]
MFAKSMVDHEKSVESTEISELVGGRVHNQLGYTRPSPVLRIDEPVAQSLLKRSPFDAVPDDILYELFMSLAGEPSAETCDTLVFLSHLCSNWRSIIVRAPLLWQFATMYFSGSSRDHSATIESFLNRAQDQPISFGLFFRKTPSFTSFLIPILRRHAPRIHRLHFTANNLATLWSYLDNIFSQCLFSPGDHEVISRPEPSFPIFVSAAVPTWPSYLGITSLSFVYSSLNLQGVFLVVKISQRTLQRLKLYFQNRYEVVTPTHWLLMDGPDLELPQLRSLDLGYNDPLSLLPSLVSLTVHDFGGCPDADTPSADLVPFPAPSRVPVLVQSNAHPLDHFLATLVHAVPNPDVLASLRFTGLDCFASCVLEHALDYLGPDLRELQVSKCSPEMLDAFVASVSCGEFRWILKRLTIRGMDTDELLESVWIRHLIMHERLEVRIPPLSHSNTIICDSPYVGYAL